MLAIEVELLTGRYTATAYNDRWRGEWPPHPARFFSALVAALYEGGNAADERHALSWLEGLEPPSLSVALEGAHPRDVKSSFVPVNDVSAIGDPGKPIREAEKQLHVLRTTGASASEIRQGEVKLAKTKARFDEEVGELARLGAATDKAVNQAAAYVPEHRTRKERTFPVVIPGERTFAFVWSDADPAARRPALGRLCERVTRLGHSSSLVRCCISRRDWPLTLVPSPERGEPLRVVGPGQLERLDVEFKRHRGIEPRTLPFRSQRYAPPLPQSSGPTPRGAFADGDRWLVFERVDGARLLSSRGIALARAVRAALLEQAGELGVALPQSLSGHTGSNPTEEPHVAIVPLVFVGSPHADASIQAVAFVPPADLAPADRSVLVRVLAAFEQDRGKDGILTFVGERLPPGRYVREPSPTKRSSRPATWCRESRRFLTATPIALDRNPGNLRSNFERTAHRAAVEAQRIIAEACERQGLPRPERIEVGFSPFIPGAQHARDFDARAKRGGLARVRVHADIEFPVAVYGPLLLGATRYFGGGLCLPAPGAPSSGGEP